MVDDYGNPIAINGYDAWGIPNAANGGRFQYTGQAWLPELGMWYYKARIYSPTLGRFLQTDPAAYQDQVNLYAYVGNDPVSMIDPTGASGVLTIAANDYHAWLEYHKDGRRAASTWGRFADDHGAAGSKAGVQINTERDLNYHWQARRQIRIDDRGERRLFNYLRAEMKDHTWELWNDCVDFAEGGWTAVTGETFKDQWGPQMPDSLVSELNQMNRDKPISLPQVAAQKGYSSVSLDQKNNTITGTFTPIGTRIPHEVKCDDKGVCTGQ